MELEEVRGSRKDKFSKENKKSIEKPTDEESSKGSLPDKKNRKLTIWLLIIFSIISLIIGMMIGYGVVGEGNALDIFRIDTWSHLFKLVFG